MHLQRWLTGIIAVPVLIYVIGFGPRWLFHLLLFLAALQGQREFYRFAAPELPTPLRGMIHFITLLLFTALSRGELFLSQAVMFLWAAVPMAYFMFTYSRDGQGPDGALGMAVLAPFYISLPLSLLVIVDRFPRGNLWIFLLLIVVFANDTAAFYTGRNLGRHKLHPEVSPGKTWEGAVGGWVGSLVAAFVGSSLLGLYPVNVALAAWASGVAVAGQIGDLAESMLKRRYGVKDSGGILPGHGGILDRIDGLLFSIPLLYGFLSWSVT